MLSKLNCALEYSPPNKKFVLNKMSKKTPVSNKQSNNLFKYFSPASKASSGENDNVARSLNDALSPTPKKKKIEHHEKPKESSKEVQQKSVKEETKRKLDTESEHSEKENHDDEVVEGKRPRKKVDYSRFL